jgi:hypothetical protein
MTVDLDTSPLTAWVLSSKGNVGLTLSIRCHACHTEYKLREALKRFRAFRDVGKDGAICEWLACFRLSEHLAKYCSQHIIDACISKKWTDRWSDILPERAKLALRNGLAPPNHPWSSAGIEAFEHFVRKYQSGEKVNAIVLDLEFHQNRVYMAAVCDFLTGDEILDTWLDNEWTGAPGSIVLDAELPAADIYGRLENASKD